MSEARGAVNHQSVSEAPIVCATRGGQGSRAAQRRAVEEAQSSRRPLVFLYVADLGEIGDHDPSLRQALAGELSWLGHALLRLARRRAIRSGVDAGVAIRRGELKAAIVEFVKTQGAHRLLLGAPRGTTTSVFGDDAIERFAQRIEAESGVSVEVIRPQELDETGADVIASS